MAKYLLTLDPVTYTNLMIMPSNLLVKMGISILPNGYWNLMGKLTLALIMNGLTRKAVLIIIWIC